MDDTNEGLARQGVHFFTDRERPVVGGPAVPIGKLGGRLLFARLFAEGEEFEEAGVEKEGVVFLEGLGEEVGVFVNRGEQLWIRPEWLLEVQGA